MARTENKLERKGKSEVHHGKVYSPPADSREGNEKRARSEELEKAGKLEEKWRLIRECKMFLEENSGTWKKRTEEERIRIDKEDKQTRLEMVEKKRKILERQETRS